MGKYKWVPINIYKNFGEESNLTMSDSCSESDAGSTDNSLSCTESLDHLDSTRPELLDSNKSKDTSSTDAESEQEEEREQSTRVSFMVNQSISVSESKRKLDPTETSLKRRSVEDAKT